MKYIRSAVMAAVITAGAGAAGDPGVGDGWEFGKEESGIRAYIRNYPGTGLKEFKGTMYVRGVRLSSMVATFDDTPSYPGWMHNCIESRLLKKINVHERITYTVTRAPWPATNRDVVVYSLMTQDPKTLTVTIAISGRPDYFPKQKKCVRIPMIRSLWTFMPLESGEVIITYQTVNDSGGDLPLWLLNLSVLDLPLSTMDKFRMVSAEAKYAAAVYDVIEEPVTTVMSAEAKAEG